MRPAALDVARFRLLIAVAIASLAVGCAGREAVRRAEAAPPTRAVAARAALPAALGQLRRELAAAAGTRPIDLAGESRGTEALLRAVVPARLLFRPDTALLAEDGAGLLREWGSELARNPRLIIAIEGHTDEIGRAAYNLEFSRQRAETVRDAMIAAGVAPERLSAAGVGEARPLAAERSIAARERNRRIEIRVLLR
jgi:outer membrane protein OmpA-like peptidoglycan-associated protein